VTEYLVDLVGRLGHWSYLLIFVVATLESAAFVGLAVPGEALVLAAGFLASRGLLDLDGLIVTVALGAMVGDSFGYELGRRWGRGKATQWGRWAGLTTERMHRADRFFERHGRKAVLLGRFVGFARALVPFLAGTSRMKYRHFLAYNALGAFLWSPIIVMLGYLLGASWGIAERWIGRASAIIGVLLIFLLAFTWLWRWASSHESAVKRTWRKVYATPAWAALEHRLAPLTAFAKARLSPVGFFGIRLTLAALIFIGAAWAFGGIAEDVMTGDPLTRVDELIANWLHRHATEPLTQVMLWVSDLHGLVVLGSATTAITLLLLWKRDVYAALGVAIAIPGGMLVNLLMKQAMQRSRPIFESPLLVLESFSFPSGHVAGATLFYGTLVVLLSGRARCWSQGVAFTLGAFLMVLLVAFSRMYLGVHYLSDVLAAFFEALAWLVLCFAGVHWLRHARAVRDEGTRL